MTKTSIEKFLDLYPPGKNKVHKRMRTSHGVKITPAKARQWLAKLFKGQRGVSITHVKVLAAEMRKGVWMDTSDPVKFDWYDRLVDGQHRLMAVVESGVTIETTVTWGVDPKAYLHMDENTKVRDAGAYLVGFKNPKAAVSAYRVLLDYEHLQERAVEEHARQTKGFLAFGRRSGDKWKADREEVLNWCVEHKKALEHVVALVKSKDGRTVLPPAAVAAGFYLWIYLKWPKEADAFMKKLVEGVDFDGPDDPVYQLQRTLLRLKSVNARTMGTRVPHFQWGALLLKGWNAYMNGIELSRLTFTVNEGWPILTDRKQRKRRRSKAA